MRKNKPKKIQVKAQDTYNEALNREWCECHASEWCEHNKEEHDEKSVS